MCGRFENKVREDWMMEKFAEFDTDILFRNEDNLRKQENIAPTSSILALRNDN